MFLRNYQFLHKHNVRSKSRSFLNAFRIGVGLIVSLSVEDIKGVNNQGTTCKLFYLDKAI